FATGKKAAPPPPIVAAAAAAPPAALATAALSVTSDPDGATVRWNGKPMGSTPLSVDLPVGPQTLVLSKEGFDDEPIVVELQAGATDARTRAVKLRPVVAAAPLKSAAHTSPRGPAGKGGRPSGTTPATTSTAAATTTPSAEGPRKVVPKDNW